VKQLAAAAAAMALAALTAAALAPARPLPSARHCPIFPRSSQWNQRADKLPLLSNSTAMVAAVGASRSSHADFGSGLYNGGPIGIPYTTVPKGQKRVHVSFDYADESDKGPYPVPPNAPIEGGRGSDGDRHVLVVDRARCRLYELFAAFPQGGGSSWKAGSGAIWNLRSNRLRHAGWTSADAAGLPILPGLARYDEVKRGKIDHALRITVPRTRKKYIYPARHLASSDTDPNLPAMGQRVRLKKSVNVKRFPRQARVVLRALQRYGALVADNGSAWYVSGAPNKHWSNDDLHSFGQIKGSDFEFVDTSGLKRPRR
jgi:hypothetical protein